MTAESASGTPDCAPGSSSTAGVLISARALRAALDTGGPGLAPVVLDCRAALSDPEAGRRAWSEATVPGAQHVDLELDASSPPRAGISGRHPLPDPEVFAAKARAWGVDATREVVVFDDAGGGYAARVWWIFRWLGHDAVRVLDGGIAAWEGEGGSLQPGGPAEIPSGAREPFVARPRSEMLISTAELERTLPLFRLVDARAPERYAGEQEPLDPIAGHIEGAANHFWKDSLTASGTFAEPSILAAKLSEYFRDRAPQQVVAYCGSGVTACHLLLAMQHAGHPGARLYAGSWSEWITDPARPRTPATAPRIPG